ncbi:MAG: metalloregulator ArsR/SmtB family transcription factor [Chitinispirillaceae bacterium]|jgi:DNA-binding transcriptional ArsR family regulator
MKDFVAVTKALSDSNRIRALIALRRGELCVCRIIALLGLAPSTVSKHMSVLKHAGLVQCRKEERWMYYRLPTAEDRTAMIREGLDWLFRSLTKDQCIKNDSAHLARILRQSPETLCRKRIKK